MFHDGFMNGSMWFSWIFWLVIVAFIVWLLVTQLNKGRQDSQSVSHDSPMDILKKRYAKGEISKEEFERMKKDLNN